MRAFCLVMIMMRKFSLTNPWQFRSRKLGFNVQSPDTIPDAILDTKYKFTQFPNTNPPSSLQWRKSQGVEEETGRSRRKVNIWKKWECLSQFSFYVVHDICSLLPCGDHLTAQIFRTHVTVNTKTKQTWWQDFNKIVSLQCSGAGPKCTSGPDQLGSVWPFVRYLQKFSLPTESGFRAAF